MLVMLALLLVRAFYLFNPSEQPELESSFRSAWDDHGCCALSNIKFWKGDEEPIHSPDAQKPPSASANEGASVAVAVRNRD
jgi:hypothetical protein